MNLVRYFHLSHLGLLSLLASTSWVIAGDWQLTFDQLSSHEKSFRIVVISDGSITAFVKDRKSNEFEKTSQSKVDSETSEELRCKVIKLHTCLQLSELRTKSARDVDIKYRVVYEHHGAEIELRWLAGQIGSDISASEVYLSILELLNRTSDLDVKLKPDPFLKSPKRDTTKMDSR